MAKKVKKPVQKVVDPVVVSEVNPLDGLFSQPIANRALNGQLSEDEKVEISATYRKVFRVEMKRSCNNCFADAFFELYNLYKANRTGFYDRYNCEYALKAGSVMTMFGNGDLTVTNHNLTNALAELHLKGNKAKVRFFQRLPDDWELRIG